MTPPVPTSPFGPSSRRRTTPPPAALEALAMFAVALVLRLAHLYFMSGWRVQFTLDSLDYDTLAWNLASGAGFRLPAGGQGAFPTAFRPPAMPFVTSLVYRITGHQPLAAVILTCILGALVVLVLAEFTRSTLGSRAARAAGWIAAVHPMLVAFSALFLTETQFALTLLLAVGASAAWVKTPRAGRAFGTGLLWGTAALTRPNALALPLVVGAWAFVPLGLALPGRERARQLVLLALGVVLAVGPWTLRNARELHSFVPITTGGGHALFDGNNDVAWNDPDLRGGPVTLRGSGPAMERLKGLSEPAADALEGRLAREYISAHRAQWPGVALAKVARFWRLRADPRRGGSTWWPHAGVLENLRRTVDPLLLWSLAFLPLAAWGAVVVLRGSKRLFLSLPLLVVVTFTAQSIVFWGDLRMRVPIEPFVAFYAAAGLDDLLQRRRRRPGLRVIRGGAA